MHLEYHVYSDWVVHTSTKSLYDVVLIVGTSLPLALAAQSMCV